ncbi:MAG TPA: rhodanese-like domain-containing protein, partial [Ignavibacteria bacterium]
MDEHSNSEITVDELKEKIDKGEKVNLLDIRQPFESQIATLGGMLIPVNSLLDRLDEIEKFKDEELIIYCHSGINSHYATEFLKEKAGFKKVKNLVGGITEWANKIDPTMKKY